MAEVTKTPTGPRNSVGPEELAQQVAKLKSMDTKAQDLMAKEKPDDMDLKGAMTKLKSIKTEEKSILPSAADIQAEQAGEHTALAEGALMEGKKSLKTVETVEKSRLPTVDDINAEQAAGVSAGEMLMAGRKSLKSVETVEKQQLPSATDVQAEKKDPKRCSVKDSEQMAKALQSKSAADAKSMHLGNVNTSTGFGAGAGGGFGLNAPGHGPKVNHFAGGGSGVDTKKQIDIPAAVNTAWAQVLDDADPLRWIFCKYTENLKGIELSAKGTGGLAEFKQQIGDEMAWAGFRCYGVDKRGGTEVRRTKFVFVQVRPEAVSTIKKAKQSAHKGEVKEAISNAHLDLVVESITDLAEQGLIDRLQAATGAHKPNGYEFDDGKFIEADYYGLGIGKDCKGETVKA